MTELSEQRHTSRTDALGNQDQQLPRRKDTLKRLQADNLPMAVGEGALLIVAGHLWTGVPGEYGLDGSVVQRTNEDGEVVGYYNASLTRRQNSDPGEFDIVYGPEVVPVTDDNGVITFHSADSL